MPSFRHTWGKARVRDFQWRKCLTCDCEKMRFVHRGFKRTVYRLDGIKDHAPACVALSPLEKDIRRYVTEAKAELGI
jgi:hypothetical protein